MLAVTNVPEAGLWWETSNKINGRTRNPYDVRLTVGGSSGGEGSLISSAGSVVGVGSDIGGSIRIPAALNGIVHFLDSLYNFLFPVSSVSSQRQRLFRLLDTCLMYFRHIIKK